MTISTSISPSEKTKELVNRAIKLGYLAFNPYTNKTCNLDEIRFDHNSLDPIPIIDINHKIGFLYKNGEIMTEPQFDEIKPFELRDSLSDLISVRKGNCWGAIHHRGYQFIPTNYSSVETFCNIAIISDFNGRYSLIQTRANPSPYQYSNDVITIIPFGQYPFLCFSPLGHFNQIPFVCTGHSILAMENFNFSSVYLKLVPQIPTEFYYIRPINDSDFSSCPIFICAKLECLELHWGVIDYTGKELTPFMYDYLGDYDESNCSLLCLVNHQLEKKSLSDLTNDHRYTKHLSF